MDNFDKEAIALKYGADVYDGNGNYAGDVMFFGNDFLQKCKKITN